VNIQEYKQLAQKYQLAKRETFYTPQASLAMKKTLKEALNVTETRPRFLRNFLLSSTLVQDETDVVKQVKRTGQKMLNSKRRKLEREANSPSERIDMLHRHT
jgi:predicted ATP-dependent Lon-type protease